MFERFDKEDIIFKPELINRHKDFLSVYPPATIKILIVADGSIRFGGSGFTLQKVLEVLGNDQHQDFPSYARFEVTTAHRGNNPADIENFQFGANSLIDYDELWLFGILGGYTNNAGERESYLSSDELRIIGDFMNSGGGVLAMGDHQDLGLGLCAGVPRVRNMRKWWYSGNLPAGQMKAPGTSADRIDTVQTVNGSTNQSDQYPQPITYKPYFKYTGLGLRPAFKPFTQRYSKYPHPVLCGPLGAITVFPDHQHEGECVEPSDVSLNIQTSTGSEPEYPGSVKPEVIAFGRDLAHNSTSFGLLGAYDGHDVAGENIGRVLVDGTWHHWFNTNLDGLAIGSNADGSDHSNDWRQIQAFFRNCAIWLAPKNRQRSMRLAGQRIVLDIYPIVQDFHKWRELHLTKPSPLLCYKIGRYSLDALERVTTRCAKYAWFYEFLRTYKIEEHIKLDPRVFERVKPIPQPDPLPDFNELSFFANDEPEAIACDLIEDSILVTVFGAAMLEFWAVLEKLEADKGYRNLEPEEKLDQLFESTYKPIQGSFKQSLPMAQKFAEQRIKVETQSIELMQSSLKDHF